MPSSNSSKLLMGFISPSNSVKNTGLSLEDLSSSSFKEMKLNWYQKLRIELSFVLDDIKEWMSWGIGKRGGHK